MSEKWADFIITSTFRSLFFTKFVTMSDVNGKKKTQRRPLAVANNADEWAPVERVIFSPSASALSDITPRSRSKNDTPTTLSTARTPMTTDEFLDSHDDAAAAEEAYDNECLAENGGADDSDEEQDGAENFEALRVSALERLEALGDEDAVKHEDFIGVPDVFSSSDPSLLPGAPIGWVPPTAPEGWTSAIKTNTRTPAFKKVDNPGGWSEFCFQPKYAKAKGKGTPYKYLYHAMPAGATPVPEYEGKRMCNGWTFHYDGKWIRKAPKFHSGATRDNPFPESRKGCLDADILTRLGMTAERMMEEYGAPDALFFYQLLFPIINPIHSGIKDDPRKAFYSEVSLFSNLYAVGELQLGNGIGHRYVNTDGPELVRWDGVLTRDGVLGGSNGAILRRFDTRKDNAMFAAEIYKAISKTRWLEIKRVIKLCNNLTAKKPGEQGYNPAYKYDLIYDVLTHNVNAITKYAGLDLCGDETTWGHQGFAEAGSGITSLIMGKPGISKGGQIVMIFDIDRFRPRAYVHRHKKHKMKFKAQGPNEVHMLWQRLKHLLIDDDDDDDDTDSEEENIDPFSIQKKGIFRQKPHLTWDNYFSGDATLDYAATHGFGLTMTSRRDRLPAGIPDKYLHKEQTKTIGKCKAARFMQPIFLTKEHPSGSLLQLCSFQSTGSTNIASVNAINSCGLYGKSKERGMSKKDKKYHWAVEMNESRRLYLGSYGIVDTVDQMIKNCNMKYR